MSELERVIAGDSAAAPPEFILENLPQELAHRVLPGAPHTVYQELWHIAFWQQVTLDWVWGLETPFPASAAEGFPADGEAGRDGGREAGRESWDQLRERFFAGNRQAAEAARNAERLELPIRCPSRPGEPVRVMTVREQLESLGAHNAYHFGRIVLLRQLLGAWPPPSGGYSW